MLCSKCSEPIKPIFVSDIDGTLAMYHEDFPQFCWNYYAMKSKGHQWDGSGEFEDYIGITKEQYREAKLAYRQGGGKRTMPHYMNSRQILSAARSAGAEIWLTTTRPWMRFDSTDPDTRFWLDKYGMPYDHLLYDDNKYGKLAEIVDPARVVMILEDLAEQIDLAEKYFPGKAVQIKRPHNFAARREPRLSNLDCIFQIGERMTAWYEENK